MFEQTFELFYLLYFKSNEIRLKIYCIKFYH